MLVGDLLKCIDKVVGPGACPQITKGGTLVSESSVLTALENGRCNVLGVLSVAKTNVAKAARVILFSNSRLSATFP
jgi:hypothetical protein